MKKTLLTILTVLATLFVVKSQDYSTYTRCAEQDSLALVAFYHATNGSNWTSNQDGFSISQLSDNVLTYHTIEYPNAGMGKWLQGPVKNWFGVLLEKQQIGSTSDSIWRVVHVRPTISRRAVGNNNLKGYIPKELGLLTALKWFKTNGNLGLSGTELPKEVFHPSLLQLDIEACFLIGGIDHELQKCKKLQYFKLVDNEIDSVPNMNFLSPDHLLNNFTSTSGGAIIFYYRNKIPFSNLEPTVEYFLSFSNSKQVQYEARDQKNMGQEKEIIVQLGQKVVLSSSVGGKNATYTWYRRGVNTYLTAPTFTINSVAAKDTGFYQVSVVNDYLRLNDLNSDYANIMSSNINVRFEPLAPIVRRVRTSYSGNEIEVVFSKPMKATSKAQASEFAISSGGKSITVSDVVLGGRFNEILTLKLASSVLHGEAVSLTYNKGTVVCENGGTLASVSGREVQNLARVSPSLVKAATREDGSGIFLTFDRYLDEQTLSVNNFTVNAGGNKVIHSVVLVPGAVDQSISKTIELVLSKSLTPTDSISVSFTKGSLNALFGGAVQDFSNIAVQNLIVDNRTSVLLRVTDGTKGLIELVVKGNMKSLPFKLFDDGTNGDEVAGDNIWSTVVELTDGQYNWNVFNRSTTIQYDTIRTVDDSGKIILEINPKYFYNDELLSVGLNMQVAVADNKFTGTTHFGYRNNQLTFIVDMNQFRLKNPDVVIEPSLMGIGNDWTEGVTLLPQSDGSAIYMASVGGFNPGDIVKYNFRNGNIWENSSPLTRSHTVYANDTLRSVFGLSVNLETFAVNQRIKLYPNPVHSLLNIESDDLSVLQSMQFMNLYGQTIFEIKYPIPAIVQLTDLPKGIYLVKIIDLTGNVFVIQLVKK